MVDTADSDEDVLGRIGIRLDDAEVGHLQAACATIARRITADGLRVVGFVPSDDRVAVPPIAIHLGLALCNLTGGTIGVVDANVRYPALAELARHPRRPSAAAEHGSTPSTGQRTDHDDSVFATRWLRGSLALLTPPKVERAGEVVPQLARVLLESADLFAHVLVDLTGFELLGEHASAAACMDAVALVSRAHRSNERELIELARLMPAGRFLGVLLVG